MAEKLTLYVCHIDEGGPKPHACRRAQNALRASGHDFEKVVFAKGIPFGLFTKGRRPELKAMSGQEKLPVLRLTDGTTVSGSADIIAWAKATEPPTSGGQGVGAVSSRDLKDEDA
jgi:glutathione S-transferase